MMKAGNVLTNHANIPFSTTLPETSEKLSPVCGFNQEDAGGLETRAELKQLCGFGFTGLSSVALSS